MTRSQRLKPVSRVAEHHEQTAARAMGEYQQRLNVHENRLRELIKYREEYAHGFQIAGARGMGAAQLQDYRTFLARIDQAISQQQGQVAQARRQYEQKKDEWFHRRTRSQALEKVAERYRKQERHDEDRREQKDSDERAQRGRD